MKPADHARIRRHLALIPVYVWLVYGWTDLLRGLPIGGAGSRGPIARDFLPFYVQGLIANQRDAGALYDIDRWAAMVRSIVPTATDLRYWPVYPPQVSVLFSPLARLPYGDAMNIWMALSLAIYLGCGFAIWRVCPRLRDRGGTVALLLVADPALHAALSFAQISAIGLLCVTGGFLALRANRPFLAGIAVGSLIYKPQLGLAAAFVFLAAREWRIVFGAVAGAACQFAIGAAFWGFAILPDYVRSIVHLMPELQIEPFRVHMHSWRAFFLLLGVPAGVATAAYLLVTAVIVVVAWRCWRRDGPLALRYGVLVVATVLANPHVYAYDLIVLMPVFLIFWDWASSENQTQVGALLPRFPIAWFRRQPLGPSFDWLLYFCYVSPLFAIVAYMTRVQLSVPALTLLGAIPAAVLLSRPERSPRT